VIARSLTLAAVLAGACACQQTTPARLSPTAGPVLAASAPAPSPRLIVGRIIAIDAAQGFAFIELASDAPPAALGPDNELIARTLDLRETARLQTSTHLRGRTLGTTILSGKPSPGDEVVWLAP